jgi:hypothetical protein
MHRLFLGLLMIFSFVAMAMAVPTHSARMATVSQGMASKHVSQHSIAHTVPNSCQEYGVCGASDALCSFVCSGMATWLAPEQLANATGPVAAILIPPETPNLNGLGPERTERPPDDGLAENMCRRARTPI